MECLIASSNSLVRSHLFIVKLMEHEERPPVHTQSLVYTLAFKSRTIHNLDCLCPEQTCYKYQHLWHYRKPQDGQKTGSHFRCNIFQSEERSLSFLLNLENNVTMYSDYELNLHHLKARNQKSTRAIDLNHIWTMFETSGTKLISFIFRWTQQPSVEPKPFSISNTNPILFCFTGNYDAVAAKVLQIISSATWLVWTANT